jgi:hypothetical protein
VFLPFVVALPIAAAPLPAAALPFPVAPPPAVAPPFPVAPPAAGVQGGVSKPEACRRQLVAEPRHETAELERRLSRCPDDPYLLEELAAVRLGEGRPGEAEVLAARLVRLHPDHAQGWALLAASRYLQDDTRGALEAWSRGQPLRVRDIEIRVLSQSGPSRPSGASGLSGLSIGAPSATSGAGPAQMTRIAGIAPGEPLTLEGLVRGERRLRALPAASRARLEYRALPGGEAQVEGAVILRTGNPMGRSEWLAHGIRLLGRRVHLASADPMGQMEQWELNGTMEGTLRSGTLSLAHPAPRGTGVWRWEVHHGVGRYGALVSRLERTTVGWTHTQWLAASLQGRTQVRVDRTPGRGTFAGAGLGVTLLPLDERTSIDAEGTGWVDIGGGDPFGRLAIHAALHPRVPPLLGAPSGWAARVGVVGGSSDLPPDLLPRIGSGTRTDLLMRARSDLDAEGVVQPLFPGRAWVHGGIEYLRPVRSPGPLAIAVAGFADGVQVVASDRGPGPPVDLRGAIHVGVGLRARVPGVDGWLRVDWGLDPASGASRLSAAWVQGPPR